MALYAPTNPRPQQEDLRKMAAAINQTIQRTSGSMNTAMPMAVKTSNATISGTDLGAYGDTSLGPITFTLPSALDFPGVSYTFKNIGNVTSNILKLQPVAGQTIDGSPSRTLIINDAVTIEATNGAWLITRSYYPATKRLIYSQIVVKPGDTLSASSVAANTIQNFASNVVIPAGSMVAGQTFDIFFMGRFTSSSFGPSTTAYVRMGNTSLVVTPALALTLGVTDYGYSGKVELTVVASGTSGSIRAGGTLHFSISNMDAATTIVTQKLSTIDTTTNQNLQLSLSNSSNATGNTNTLESLRIYESRPPKASS